MKYCTNCGKGNAEDALFCHSCGDRLSAARLAAAPAKPKGKSKLPLIVFLVIAVAVIAAAVILLVSNLGGKEATAPAPTPVFSFHPHGENEPKATLEAEPAPVPAPAADSTPEFAPVPTAEPTPEPVFHTDELAGLCWVGDLYAFAHETDGEELPALMKEGGLYLVADAAIPEQILVMLHTTEEMFRAVLAEDGSALLRTSAGEYLSVQLYPAENGRIQAVLTSQSNTGTYTFLLAPRENEPEEDLTMGRILPDVDRRYYTRQEILMSVQPWVDTGYTLSEALRLARNEIYANYGNVFKDENLNRYFYEERGHIFSRDPALNADMISQMFNDYEAKNVSFIKDIEEEFK